jgi:hypothetical protein
MPARILHRIENGDHGTPWVPSPPRPQPSPARCHRNRFATALLCSPGPIVAAAVCPYVSPSRRIRSKYLYPAYVDDGDDLIVVVKDD